MKTKQFIKQLRLNVLMFVENLTSRIDYALDLKMTCSRWVFPSLRCGYFICSQPRLCTSIPCLKNVKVGLADLFNIEFPGGGLLIGGINLGIHDIQCHWSPTIVSVESCKFAFYV